MSKLGATASINFAKSKIKWSSLKAHNHRTYYDMKHDKNKFINPKLSKLNKYHTYFNYFKFMSKFVDKNKLNQQRKKYLKNRQKSRARKYSNAKTFLQSKNHRNCRCGIVTLGDHNFQKKFEKKLKKKIPGIKIPMIKNIEKGILEDYLNGFNQRHKHLKIITYAIHVDETFIHAHAEFMGTPGRTKRGKLQLNFNKSLRTEMANQKEQEQGKLPSNKVALHRFQHQEDQLIIQPTLQKEFGVSLVRKGASKDDQEQHSLAVSESAKASSYASIASSSASYLNSLNTDYRASLSKSATKSLKARKRALVSSENSLASASASFDSSAYGGYAKALSNGLTQYLPKSKRLSFNWLKLAKGSKAKAGNKIISNPLEYYANYQVSKADSASSACNSTRNNNQSLKAENSSLTSKNKKLKKVNKSVINLKNNLANDFRTEEDQPHLNHMSNHRVFKTLIFWEKQGVRRISKLVWKAKRKAKKIIKNAKIKAKDLVKPNKDGERIMRDFIWQHEDCYPNVYKKTPDKLNGDQLMQSFNDTAHNYHEYDSPEAKRKSKEIQNEANDHGITWTP